MDNHLQYLRNQVMILVSQKQSTLILIHQSEQYLEQLIYGSLDSWIAQEMKSMFIIQQMIQVQLQELQLIS